MGLSKNYIIFIMELLCVFVNSLVQFCTFFGNILRAALFTSPKIQCEYLHSWCSSLARNHFGGGGLGGIFSQPL